MSESLGLTKFSKGEAQILAALPVAKREKKPLVVASGHAQGKDFIASCITPWFLYNHIPSKVIITAPTDRQVKEIMWNEIESRFAGAQIALPGRLLKCKIDITPEHFCLGFTTKETGNMTGKFQGFHSPNILVIASEAQAIPDQIYEQIDSVLTSENSLFIMIGNPLRTTGRFAKCIKDTSHNIVIHLSCLDSINYKERREVITGMASYDWVEKRRHMYGEGSAQWCSRVLGEVPSVGIDTVFSPDLVDKGVKQTPRVVERRIVTSNDPARFGDDECVTYGHISGQVIKTDIMAMSAADQVVSHVLQMVRETGANHHIQETDGLGGPIYDFLHKLLPQGVYLQGVSMNGKPEDEEHYKNLRSEMWFHAKKQVELGKVQIPDDDFLKEELIEVTYFYNLKGKIVLEEKKLVKDRLGRSPDRADAWVLGIWAQRDSMVIRKALHDNWREDEDNLEVDTEVSTAMSA